MTIKSTVQDEPVITGSFIQSLVGAVLALLIAFGVNLTDLQTAAILGVFIVLAPVITGLFQRSRVSPVSRS